MRTIVMIPGYNEPPHHFNILAHGQNGITGLEAHGFTSVTFGQHDDRLRDRVDRLAALLEELRAQDYPAPFTLLGYSLGGLVVRGFLRAYPEQAARDVSESIMIATPNWGVLTFVMPQLTALLRMPDKAMGDMSLDSEFMHWLNGVSGRWDHVHDLRRRVWVLDGEPWVAPEGARVLTIMGLIPSRGGDNDGLVWGDSATLGSRIPAQYVIGPHANHMNIIGHFDPFVMLAKGFLSNDAVWPQTLRAILRFTQT